MPLLSSGRHVVAIDTSGFGMSDGPAGPEGVIQHYAEAVVGVMDHLGLSDAHIVGFHTGATTAVELARAQAERVRSVAIFCVLALASDDEWAEWLSRDNLATEWVPDGQGRFLETDFVGYVAHFAIPGDGETYLLDLIAKLQAGPEYCWSYEGVARYDHYANYANLRCPTLVLNAENEVLRSYTELAHTAIPHSDYQVIPGPELDVRGGWPSAPSIRRSSLMQSRVSSSESSWVRLRPQQPMGTDHDPKGTPMRTAIDRYFNEVLSNENPSAADELLTSDVICRLSTG
jgi:pimeloyl-ACP methyl ester carboxylesterase